MNRLRLLPFLLLVACSDSANQEQSATPAATTASTPPAEHQHEAPHGGTMIQLGDHFANLELVLNSNKGELHAWFHDAHAQRSIRLAARRIPMAISLEVGLARFDVMLVPVANVLTGETAGNTSQFSCKDPMLVGCKAFRGLLTPVSIQGQTLPAISFNFPSGEILPQQAR